MGETRQNANDGRNEHLKDLMTLFLFSSVV